jgi:hypothetical protein
MSDHGRLRAFAAALNFPAEGSPTMEFYLEDGTLFAIGYKRVVIGDRGPYVEFDTPNLKAKFGVPPDQVWRLENPHWRDKVYYIEHRTHNCFVMIYEQRRTVKYADYKVYKFYASPWDLYTKDGVCLASGEPPPEKKE